MPETEYKPYVIDAGYLLPPSLADFLGPDDEVHIFREVTEHLDISRLDSDFNGMGQHPYHPRLLLRLLMWGMVNRVVSTRRIEVMSHRDVSFIYVAGGQKPDFRTLHHGTLDFLSSVPFYNTRQTREKAGAFSTVTVGAFSLDIYSRVHRY